MNAKYIQISETIKRQILNGDYLMDKIPSERKLAEYSGVSYMTARRAIQHLIDDKVFVRGENGRLLINRDFAGLNDKINAILILPDWPVPDFYKYRVALEAEIKGRGGILKTVFFDHDDDNMIAEALNGDFNRIFIMQARMSSITRLKLISMKDRVVVFYTDMTADRLVCIDPVSSNHMELLVKHLQELGHQRIGLFNTQTANSIILERIEAFRAYVAKHRIKAEIFNFPAASFERTDLVARDRIKELIACGKMPCTGLVSTTIECAFGISRGIHESGMTPGKEISVCCFGGLESAQVYIPSITTVEAADEQAVCRNMIREVLDRKNPEKLMYRYDKVQLFKGESTGTAQHN